MYAAAPMLRRAIPVVCAVALLGASLGVADAAAGSPAAASLAKKRRCRKGYKLKTVTIKRNGRKVKVKRCRRVKGTSGGGDGGGGTTGAGLFEAPGRRLEGQEAVPWLQRYLFNSTFTDCPVRWPACAVEERYSHTSEGLFYYCRISGTSADIINGGRAYQVQNAVVEADGSWTFNEVVDNYGNPSYYEWHVAVDGVVTGVYQYSGTEQIGPLQYVSGARDCSY